MIFAEKIKIVFVVLSYCIIKECRTAYDVKSIHSCSHHTKYCFKTASSNLAQNVKEAEKLCHQNKVLTILDSETENAVKKFIFDNKLWVESKVMLNLIYSDFWSWKLGSSNFSLSYSNWVGGKEPKRDACVYISPQGWTATSCNISFLVICMSLKCSLVWNKTHHVSFQRGIHMDFNGNQDACVNYCEFFVSDCIGVDVFEDDCFIFRKKTQLVERTNTLHMEAETKVCGDKSKESAQREVTASDFNWVASDQDVFLLIIFLILFNIICCVLLIVLIYKTTHLYMLIRNVAEHLLEDNRTSVKSFFHSSTRTN